MAMARRTPPQKPQISAPMTFIGTNGPDREKKINNI
jgi:hypothetical protein